jgi:pilus assembly protein Flp/PilA
MQEWLSACHCNWHIQSLAGEHHLKGRKQMKDMLLKLSVRIQTLMSREEGQDLVEYGLLIALVAFAATAGMKSLAGSINTAFTTIGTTLTSYTG